jgi:hypothetical protein
MHAQSLRFPQSGRCLGVHVKDPCAVVRVDSHRPPRGLGAATSASGSINRCVFADVAENLLEEFLDDDLHFARVIAESLGADIEALTHP